MAVKVYLDLCKWRDLAHAAAGDAVGAPFQNALTIAEASVDMGLAIFSLSAQHYMETLARNRFADRAQLAKIMLQLSKGGLMAGLEQVVPCEIDRSLQRLLGRPLAPRTTQIFGLSLAQAFDQPEWNLQTPDDLSASQWKALNEMVRFYLLAGPPDGETVPGMDRQAYRAAGHNFAQGQRELGAKLIGVGPEKRRDILTARGILDISGPIKLALCRAGITESEFMSLGREGLTRFLKGIPSRWTEVEMLCQHYSNPQLAWRENDLVDIVMMCIAVVYCDVVVAEKFWVDMARRARLDTMYGTTLLTNVGDLHSVLVTRL